jgi:hypothetical protein
MVELNADVRDFDKNGFAVVKGALDRNTVANLRALCLTELQKKNTKILTDAVVNYPPIRAVLDVPAITNSLKAVLGEKFVVLPPTTVDHNGFGLFHTDTSSAEIAGFSAHRHKEFRVVELGIYLQDNNEYGGGLRVVPGSHLQHDPYVVELVRKREIRAKTDASRVRTFLKRASRGRLFGWKTKILEDVPGQYDIPSRAGDALFWDLRIAHRASPAIRTGGGILGGKIAIFYTLASNNSTSRSWFKYWADNGLLKGMRDENTVLPPATDNYEFM